MASRQMTIEDIEFEVWDKSFRVSHDTMIGPVHFIGNGLGSAISDVASVVKAVRR